MFAVEIYAAVRKFDFIEGNSRREAAREFGLSPTQNSKSQINPGASPAFRVLGVTCFERAGQKLTPARYPDAPFEFLCIWNQPQSP
jgi:hypothetical protein